MPLSQTYHRDLHKAWITANSPRIILTNGSTYTTASSVLDIITQEVPHSTGYSRQVYNPADGAWDNAQARWEFGVATATFTAPLGVSIQFDRWCVLGGVKSYSNRLVSTINTVDNRLEFSAAHPFSNGDKVTVTPDPGGTVPTALLNAGNPRELFVVGSSTNYIQVALTNGGTPLSLAGGVSDIRVRSIDGSSGFFSESASYTILPGQTYTISVQYNVGGSGVNVESA